MLFADGHVELADRKHFVELTNRGLMQLALADVPARRRLAEEPSTPPAAAPVASMPPPAGVVAHEESMTEAAGSAPPGLDKEMSKDADLGVKLAGTTEAETYKPEAGRSAGETGLPPAMTSTRTAGLVAVQTNFLRWTAGISRRFVRSDVALGEPRSLKIYDEFGKVVPVLASFQVQQNGSELQMVDGDGSVYRGRLLSGDSTFQTGAALAGAKPATNESQNLLTKSSVSKAPVPAGQFAKKEVRADQSRMPAAQNYFFRVAGTNRTLKQSVVFTGNFLAA